MDWVRYGGTHLIPTFCTEPGCKFTIEEIEAG